MLELHSPHFMRSTGIQQKEAYHIPVGTCVCVCEEGKGREGQRPERRGVKKEMHSEERDSVG